MTRLAGRAIAPGQGHREGRLLLAQLYRELTGSEMPRIVSEPGGKPRFSEGPYHFSITHTQSHVFVVLGDRPLGLDAEELSRRVSPALAGKILSPEEYRQYQQAPDQNAALLTFWVLKEAQGKLTGEGVRPWPDHTRFSLDDPRVFTRDGCVLALMEEASPAQSL